eukprot:CAMPEP_0118699892 /NCGR_PEP_ID=MMETSP0800-20121206/16206_1 /TAXON_ID=210618 ORGANISM="Striatella unipunctata, Strain CCMP2910" /NCGR_SAMPLE_ID=MMETSP0800 /ASSEMBLY_ACC=CAM_ASM_000638 /LENGTH=113 /DNA_ID=CAMNT_0006600269 /DNA_START=179 /DNA_END=517 /DNA_ORIENTATION=-
MFGNNNNTTTTRLFSLCCIIAAASASSLSSSNSNNRIPFVFLVPRGGSSNEFSSQCESVKAKVIDKAMKEIDALKTSILDASQIVDGFGNKADSICNQALEEFALNAPDAGDD